MKKKIIVVAIIALLVFSYAYFDIGDYASLESIQAHKESLKLFVGDNVILATLLYIAVYVITTALSLPIAAVLSLLGGFLFGSILGTLFTVIGATLGAVVVFLLARYLFEDWFRKIAGEKVDKLNQEFQDDAFNHLLFLRIVPLFPFFLVNVAPAFTKIKLRDYFWGTFLGIIPGTFVFVNTGTALGDIRSTSDILSMQVLVAFTLLGLLSLIPSIYKRWKKKKGDTHLVDKHSKMTIDDM